MPKTMQGLYHFQAVFFYIQKQWVARWRPTLGVLVGQMRCH